MCISPDDALRLCASQIIFQRIRIKEIGVRLNQSHDSLAMRESNEKTDGATKIAKLDRKEKRLSSRGIVSSERFSCEPRTKNSFVVFANAFLMRSRITFRSNNVKKIDLANTKKLCIASRQNAIIGRIRESYWCSGADSYSILSAPYYRSCYRELSKDRENKALWKGQKRWF